MFDENAFFRQATLRISSSLNIETAMQSCMNYLQDFIPISGMYFCLYEPEFNRGRLLAYIWPKNLPKPMTTVPVPKESWQGMTEEWKKGKQVRIINDIKTQPVHMRNAFSMLFPPACSHIIMDLELENERLGQFGIFQQKNNQYTKTDADMIHQLHEPFAIAVSNILKHREIVRLKNMLADDNRYLQGQILKMGGDVIIGADCGLRDIMQMVRQVAPLKSPVMLMGETGTGKEIIANAIHRSSRQSENTYIKVNCGAIPDNLIDSELFGHEKGAFTGALSRKRGRFERAHNGTIFLDEIGELPLHAQVRLLRVLQENEIERVGGAHPIPINVRIISATHRNLEEMVKNGSFREDLWFRLNVFPIVIPPLRQRPMDIPALVNHFIECKRNELKLHEMPVIDPGTLEKLQQYQWPGNVRELENLIERALILNQINPPGTFLRLDPFSGAPIPARPIEQRQGNSNTMLLNDVITHHIKQALAQTNNIIEGPSGAAKLLGLHPSTLRGRMKKLGIPYGRKAMLK